MELNKMVGRLYKGRIPDARFPDFSNHIWFKVLFFTMLILFLGGCQARQVFSILEGEGSLLVLIRSDKQADYLLRYEGDKPADIQRVQLNYTSGPELALYTDVVEMVLVAGEHEVILDETGNVPSGKFFELQTGDEFTLRVTYHGQQLGRNRLASLTFTYHSEGRETIEKVELSDTTIAVE
jgi:hypothetical protein